MPQLGIPRIRRDTFTPSPPSALFALVTKLSEQVGTKRAEFLIERLLDDHNAVVVSGDALLWAWCAAHELANADVHRDGKWFYLTAVECASLVHDLPMSTGEGKTTTPELRARLNEVRWAIDELDGARRAANQRGAARATKIKRERLAQLDRSVARLERILEITPLKAIRRLSTGPSPPFCSGAPDERTDGPLKAADGIQQTIR